MPFYDHMLTALSKHSLIDMTVKATGDTHIDVHHTVEDVAITFGEVLRTALGNKAGIRRFGEATVPLDEALAHAVVDVSGRPYLVHGGEPAGQEYHLIGGHFTGSLTRHVFEAITLHAGICLHMNVTAGRDPHHIVEAQFKAFARALRAAVEPDPRRRRASPPPRVRCDRQSAEGRRHHQPRRRTEAGLARGQAHRHRPRLRLRQRPLRRPRPRARRCRGDPQFQAARTCSTPTASWSPASARSKR